MRRRPCTDANQPEIVKALRQAGAQVLILAAQGQGCPDLLVQYRGRIFLIEVKIPGAKLNALEEKFKSVWGSSVAHSIDEALEVIGIKF